MKQRYSLKTCADSIEQLMDIANGRRKSESRDRMELLNEPAQQVVALLREPGAFAAVLEALDKIRMEPRPNAGAGPP